MATTEQDLADEVQWGLSVLGIALPLMPLSGADRTLDLRTRNVSLIFSSIVNDYTATRLKKALLPLLFGAAWKVLDITVELALANAGRTPKKFGRWRIDEKVTEIQTAGYLPALLRTLRRNRDTH